MASNRSLSRFAYLRRALCQIKSHQGIWSGAIDSEMVLRRLSKLSTGPVSYQETALSTVGALGRQFSNEDLCTALEILLQRLSASTSAPIRNVAVTEVCTSQIFVRTVR